MSPPRLDGVEAVLLDYGDTLVWFDRDAVDIDGAQRRVVERLAAAGIEPPPLATLRAAVHDRVENEVLAHGASGALEEIDIRGLERRAFADIGVRADDAVLDDCARIVQEAWFAGARLHDDVLPALAALRNRGVRLIVCSNAAYRSASLHEQLAHVGLMPAIDGAVFSSEVGWRKPSAQMYDAAMRRAGSTAAHTLMVGDRLREDVEGAVAHGLRAVLVARDAAGVVELDAPVPHTRVASLALLPALLNDVTMSAGDRPQS